MSCLKELSPEPMLVLKSRVHCRSETRSKDVSEIYGGEIFGIAAVPVVARGPLLHVL